MGKSLHSPGSDSRRGGEPEEEAYLRLVGERVRLQRVHRSMSRKALSHASGVSERYLAELERGTGNASLLVLRHIASAMSLKVDDLVGEDPDRPIDMAIAIQQLEQLSPQDVVEARQLLVSRFGRKSASSRGRIALVGLKGAGKAAIGRACAKSLGIPLIELDREIERASGMDLGEVFAVHGEQVYRRLEHESLSAVVNTIPRAVITTGGGIVSSPASFEMLMSSCFVIWIKASPEQLVEKAQQELTLRKGGLSRQAQDELMRALATREPLYARADAVIDTSNKTAEETMRELFKLVRVETGAQMTNGAHHAAPAEQDTARS